MDRRETNAQPPRLVLFTPAAGEIDRLAPLLAACCRNAGAAAVILRTGTATSDEILARARVLLPLIQESGAALLFENNAALAVKAGADGAHLTSPDALQRSLSALKPGRIAGAAGLATRHDAMTAGERGADYVMFGEPAEQPRPAPKTIIDRVQWWSEIFEIPCVAYAAQLDEVAAFAAAGADFIALDEAIWQASEGPLEATARAAAHLQREPTA